MVAAIGNGNVAPHPRNRSSDPSLTRLLSVSKSSWVVTTQSNVRTERIKTPDPPCVVCRGRGRIECHNCHGRGRTNHVNLAVLPKGEWPKWSRSCGGSGLGYCDRCLGTGEYRYIMGFQFMGRHTDHSQVKETNQVRGKTLTHSFTDQLLNDEQSDSRTGS